MPADTQHAIPSAEATAYPVWIIVSGKLHDRYPRGAVVYCHSGHMSADYRHLCETGTLPPKEPTDAR